MMLPSWVKRVTIQQMREIANLNGVTSLAAGPKVTLEGGNIRVDVAARRNGGLFWGSVWLRSYQGRTQNWRDFPGQTLCDCAEAEAIRMALPEIVDVYLYDEPVEKLLGTDEELLRMVVATYN